MKAKNELIVLSGEARTKARSRSNVLRGVIVVLLSIDNSWARLAPDSNFATVNAQPFCVFRWSHGSTLSSLCYHSVVNQKRENRIDLSVLLCIEMYEFV